MSHFKIFTIGNVIKDKPLDSDIIELYPIEIISQFGDELDLEEMIANISVDLMGNVSNPSVTPTTILKADWLPIGDSNRITSPNVKRGELVIIYRFGETDKFYWNTLGTHNTKRRRKEKVVYRFGNTDEFDVDLDETNSYFITVDTVDKKVRLDTVDNDGEETWYKIELDTVNGVMTFLDGRENSIIMNSKEDTLSLDIKKDINVLVGKDTNVEVTENVNFDVLKNVTGEIGDSLALNIIKDVNIGIDGSCDLESKKYVALKTPTFSVTNDTGELLSMMIELIDTIIGQMGIGNLGKPVPLDPPTIAKLTAVKTKIESFT